MKRKAGWDTLLQIGSGSFLKAPQMSPEREQLKAYGAKAAVYGIPFDSSVIYRSGANMGPKALRDASVQFLSYHFEYDLDVLETYRLVDCGDAKVVPSNAKKTLDSASRDILEILNAGTMPVILGGDHAITIAGTKALSDYSSGQIGLILLDTHMDTAMEVGGEELNHCCPITRTLEFKNYSPKSIAIVGPSGILNPKEEKEYVEDHEITMYTLQDMIDRGIEKIAKKAAEVAHTGTESVYLTVDIDVLDAAYAPGTGVPTPSGMTSRELLKAIKIIASKGIDALDLVEVAPAYDLSGRTASIGCRILLDALAANAPNLDKKKP